MEFRDSFMNGLVTSYEAVSINGIPVGQVMKQFQ